MASPFLYRVIADGCTDVFFAPDNPGDCQVMGFCNQYTEFPIGKQFHYAGIRFLPGMFSQLFAISASELNNHTEDLSLVLPQLADFIRQNGHPQNHLNQIKTHFDAHFLQLMHTAKLRTDHRFDAALALILQNPAALELEKGLDTGISPRQLRRLFDFYIGDSPKSFSKVLRFQRLLKQNAISKNIPQNQLYLDAGYYDQAHFIKEFRTFYGLTPGRVL